MTGARLQATRTFRSEPVDHTIVEGILDEARWCGSARNRQPWHLFVVTAPSRRRALAARAPYGTFLRDAPVVVVIGLDHERGRLDTELDGGRLVQTILRACEDRALGSCPATFFPETAHRAVRDLLGAPPNLTTRTAVALGWPAAPFAATTASTSAIPTGRRSTADVITRDDRSS